MKSQATSAFCCGGVSAVMGSSDLNEHTLVSGARSGNQLSCSLPSEADRPIVGMACQAQFLVNTDEADTSSNCTPCHAWTTPQNKYPDRETGRLGIPGEPCSHRACPENPLDKDGIYDPKPCADDGHAGNNKSCSSYGCSRLFAAATLLQGNHCYVVNDI